MRKYFIILASLAVAGCMVSEISEETVDVNIDYPTYTAVFDDESTKVYVDTDLKMHWNAGDGISIFRTTGNQRYSFDGADGDREGTFSAQSDPQEGSELQRTYAVYPYSDNTSIDTDGVITLNLPSVQHYAENSFGLEANTMVAVTESKESDKLYFKNLCGYLVVKLYGEGTIKSITLTGNNGEKLSGQATVAPIYGEAPALTMSESAGTNITLDCGEGVTLGNTAENATAFWLAVPPVTFTNGFTVTVTTDESGTITKRMGVERSVERNVKYSLAVVKVTPLRITFDSSDLVVMPTNTTRDIHYLITSSTGNITVEAQSSGNVEAAVEKNDAYTGVIRVTTGSVIDETTNVVVLVSNGSQAIMRTLNFEEEAIEVEENTTKEVSDAGGEVALEFFSNTPCHAVIPEDAQNWISVVPPTKALTKQTITLAVEDNTGAARSATVTVQSEDGTLSLSYLIDQPAGHDYQLSIEREALISIYNALDGNSWSYGYNEKWCSDYPVGEWHGVGVNSDGFVTSLYLTGLGELPAGIKQLSKLEQLTINYYNGDNNYEIPRAIFSLENLRTLHLYGSNLIGTIPNDIGSLVNLRHLEIDDTKISGSLPEAIGNLNDLEYMDLQWNQISGELPESMGNLTKLRHLMLRRNQLGGNIPVSVQKLPIWKYDWGRIISENYFNKQTLSIPAPTIEGVTMGGENVRYDDNTPGYFVLIQWSAQYDDYLYAQIDALNQICSKHDGQVEVLGLLSSSREVDVNSVESYIANNGIMWPSIFWTQESEVIVGQELSFDGISRHEYAAPCFPAIFVFHEGEVVYWDLEVYGGVSGLDDFLSINVLGEQPNYYISTDYSLDGVYTKVKSATIGEGINIVLMGDAYSDRQISGGEYTSNLNRIVDALFTEEPYKSFEDYFNVYYVNVVSAVEGYEHDGQALMTFFGSGTFVGGDKNKCIEYAKNCLSENDLDNALIIVSMNSTKYAGTCHMFSDSVVGGDYGKGLSIAYFPMGSLEEIVRHEAGGHGFAKLADEYAYESMGAVPQDVISDERRMETYGWWKNVDFTDDPTQVKWAQFIADPRYAAENIGCYEGAFTYWTGAWRPTENSIMRYNTGGFNAPSRYAIWYRINKLAYGDSWNGTYEDFVEYDAVNRTPAAVARRNARRNCVEKNLPPLAPPVVVGHSWRDAK